MVLTLVASMYWALSYLFSNPIWALYSHSPQHLRETIGQVRTYSPSEHCSDEPHGLKWAAALGHSLPCFLCCLDRASTFLCLATFKAQPNTFLMYSLALFKACLALPKRPRHSKASTLVTSWSGPNLISSCPIAHPTSFSSVQLLLFKLCLAFSSSNEILYYFSPLT